MSKVDLINKISEIHQALDDRKNDLAEHLIREVDESQIHEFPELHFEYSYLVSRLRHRQGKYGEAKAHIEKAVGIYKSNRELIAELQYAEFKQIEGLVLLALNENAKARKLSLIHI